MNGTVLTEDDVREALRACYGSRAVYGQAVNVVDLGLVAGIALAVDAEAPGAGIPGVPVRQALRLTLLRGFGDEDGEAQMAAQIGNRMAGIEELSRTLVEFADEPRWSEARVNAQGRRTLGLDAKRFPILNNRKAGRS